MPGFGLLRLHSTYRHDLKIYASDEGRVQMTAAAFAGVRILFFFCLFFCPYKMPVKHVMSQFAVRESGNRTITG